MGDPQIWPWFDLDRNCLGVFHLSGHLQKELHNCSPLVTRFTSDTAQTPPLSHPPAPLPPSPPTHTVGGGVVGGWWWVCIWWVVVVGIGMVVVVLGGGWWVGGSFECPPC